MNCKGELTDMCKTRCDLRNKNGPEEMGGYMDENKITRSRVICPGDKSVNEYGS